MNERGLLPVTLAVGTSITLSLLKKKTIEVLRSFYCCENGPLSFRLMSNGCGIWLFYERPVRGSQDYQRLR